MARTLLKDYREQLKRGIKEPEFKIDKYPELKKKVDYLNQLFSSIPDTCQF
jgi:AGCS family alanine or glycine:cation symporter